MASSFCRLSYLCSVVGLTANLASTRKRGASVRLNHLIDVVSDRNATPHTELLLRLRRFKATSLGPITQIT
jgi:hypothetical protein